MTLVHSIRTKEGVGRGISLLHFFLHVAIYSLGRHVCIDLPSIITYLPTYPSFYSWRSRRHVLAAAQHAALQVSQTRSPQTRHSCARLKEEEEGDLEKKWDGGTLLLVLVVPAGGALATEVRRRCPGSVVEMLALWLSAFVAA